MSTGTAHHKFAYNQVQFLALVCVWLGIAISGVVLFEPAPVDAMMICLVALLPLTGLSIFNSRHMPLVVLLLLFCASGFVTAGFSEHLAHSVKHNAITLYLCLFAIVIAGFIYVNPKAHMHVILSGYMLAAFIAALCAIVGYFDVIPPLTDLFTKYSRGSGTFKDPNVLGPFLVPPILYAFHLWVRQDLVRGLLPAALMLFLIFALLITFSRGAWMHLVLSLGLFTYLSFLTASTSAQRVKIILLVLAGVLAASVVIVGALQSKLVRDLFEHRAALTHSYDVGPNGRFGGQRKAMDVILENPVGIGTYVFGFRYHHEQPHNNYLTMFLRNGWVGGLAYIALISATLWLGLKAVFRRTEIGPVFLVVYAAFAGLCVENMLLETDHWRHFFLLLGLVWGGISTAQTGHSSARYGKTCARGQAIHPPAGSAAV